jgi:hypothetical protein
VQRLSAQHPALTVDIILSQVFINMHRIDEPFPLS